VNGQGPRRLAQDLLRKARVDQPPLRLRKLVKSLGVAVERTKLDTHVSSLLLRGSEPRIIVNKALGRTGRRFATAHALGHHLLHDVGTTAFVTDLTVQLRVGSPPLTDPREIEANDFALELLLPEYLLREDLAQEPVDLSDRGGLARLADRYRVSPGLVAVRALELGFLWGR